MIQDGQQIASDVVDFSGVLVHLFKHILDVRLPQAPEAFFDQISGEFCSPDPDGRLAAAQHITEQFYEFVYILPGIPFR